MKRMVTIRPLQDDGDAAAFHALNEEWIALHFTIEEKDREILGNPETAILHKGGYIFMAESTNGVVGCAALIPMGGGIYELSKMAVSPRHRGQGIGRALLEHVIAHAREIGAASLFLGSSRKLANAVHLYESVGFRHVARENLPPLPYARADVFMEMPLRDAMRVGTMGIVELGGDV